MSRSARSPEGPELSVGAPIDQWRRPGPHSREQTRRLRGARQETINVGPEIRRSADLASPLDMAFLRMAVANGLADKPAVERCLQFLDQSQQRGQTVSAPLAAVHLAILTREAAEKLAESAKAQLAAQ